MLTKTDIIHALGNAYSKTDDILIEQLLNYYTIYLETWAHIKKEQYRIPVAADAPQHRGTRYHLNIAFSTMNDCAKNIRAILELLGLSKKNKKIELTTKNETTLSLLEQMNALDDE